MTYRDTLTRLGGTTDEKCQKVLDLLLRKVIEPEAALAVLTTLIGRAQAQAVVLAEASLSAELSIQLGVGVPSVSTSIKAQPERVKQAVGTLLGTVSTTPDIQARLARMVKGIVYKSASDAYSESVSRSKRVKGWVRDLEPDACQMCTWWWRDGRVWPSDHVMPTHSGCTCTPKPVTQREPIKAVSTTR